MNAASDSSDSDDSPHKQSPVAERNSASHAQSLSYHAANYASDSDESSDNESTGEDENKLHRLLSATMDKSNRVLHSEGEQSLTNTASLIKSDSHRIELNDLIKSLDDDAASSGDESNDDQQDSLAHALLREDVKKQLKTLAQSETMFQSMNEHQMRRLEQEETEQMLADDLSKWNKVINSFQDSRNKPIIYADASKRSHNTHESISIIRDFDQTLSQKRIASDSVNVTNDFDMAEAAAPVDNLHTKTEMIERAKQIAQKKKEMAIRNAKLARLKKIKSKEYRRRLRRRKAKEDEKQASFVELDQDEIKEQLEEERRQLIKERVTLRHKAQTQWSKRAQRYSHASAGTLNALTQKFQLANELRKKQSALHEDEEEETMRNLDNPETREETINQLLSMDGGSKDDRNSHKSLLNMKFMKEAREKQKDETMHMLAQMDEEDDEMNENSSDDEAPQREAPQVEKSQYGKQSFAPTGKRTQQQESDSSSGEDSANDDESKEGADTSARSKVKLQSNSFALKPNHSDAKLKETVKEDDSSDSDDYEDDQQMKEADESSSGDEDDSDSSSGDELVPNQKDIPMFLLQRMNNKKRKRQSSVNGNVKMTRALDSDDDTSSDEDDVPRSNPWLYKNNLGEHKRNSKKSRTKLVQQSESESDSSSDSSDSDEDDANITFQQDVKKAAFAADNVQLEFEREKQRAIDQNIVMPDLQSATLPGWGGEFIGEGTTWREEFEEKQDKIANIETQLREKKAQERADTSMSHVLIRDTARVPDQYLLENQRHSKDQHEARIYSQLHDRAHSVPLGQEWNSASAFSNSITPRINLIPGRKIEALSLDKAELFAKINDTKYSARRLTKDRKQSAKAR